MNIVYLNQLSIIYSQNSICTDQENNAAVCAYNVFIPSNSSFKNPSGELNMYAAVDGFVILYCKYYFLYNQKLEFS